MFKCTEFSLIFLIFTFVFIFISPSNGVTLDEDLTLTQSEKLTLDKFRARVSSRLPHEYMRSDIYLVRWLRARKFKIDDAERLLMETLQWREKNKMDTISKEDWSDFEQEYRYSVEGCDREGRPVISVYLGDWDLRKAAVTGQTPRLMRYIDKLVEDVIILIRASQNNGQNITQFSLIMDLNHYNLIQQGCAQCIPVQLHFLRILQTYYTGTIHRITIINAPKIFEPVLQIIKPLLSPRARQIFTVHGKDRAQWQQLLMQESLPTTLTKSYGGLKESPFEMEFFKEIGYFDCSKSAN